MQAVASCLAGEGTEYRTNFAAFLADKLGFPQEGIDDFGYIAVTRYFSSRSRNMHEVTAVFAMVGIRDMVKSAANKLGPLGNQAGIRIVVPGFLMTNFKALENLGYQMKASKGEVRRVIKFDNEIMDLMMDVRFKGVWKRVRPESAKNTSAQLDNSGPETMTVSRITEFFAGNPEKMETGAEDDDMNAP